MIAREKNKYYVLRDLFRVTEAKNGLQSLFERLSIKEQRIVLYGASEICDLFLRRCVREGVKIAGISDRLVCSDGWTYLGIPIISRDSLLKMVDVCVIITSIGYEDEIREELYKRGLYNTIQLREILRI